MIRAAIRDKAMVFEEAEAKRVDKDILEVSNLAAKMNRGYFKKEKSVEEQLDYEYYSEDKPYS